MILQIKYISKYFYKKIYDSKKASAMFFCLVFSLSAYSGEIHYDCFSFVQEAMRKDPIVQEKRFSTQLKKEKLASLKAEAILPSFSFYMLVGPAPGLRQEMNDKGNTVDEVQELVDRKSTRLNSSHVRISYAVFCLKKKNS